MSHSSDANKAPLTAACCLIGDEILNGKTRDSNSNYLAKFLFELGIDLKRIQVIPDEYEAIAETVGHYSSQYDLVFTSGGIGPTHDDITYEAIAKIYQLPLQLDSKTCEDMERLSKLKDPQWTLTEARKRMATFPEPSEKLRFNPNIWVPIVLVNSNIYILPGIPRLFEALLDSLKPVFLDRVGEVKGYHRMQIATQLPEGEIAPFLTQVQESCLQRNVKIGSYPNYQPDENGTRVVVSVVGRDEQDIKEIGETIVKGINGWITKGKI